MFLRKKENKINDSYSNRISIINQYKSTNKDNNDNSKKKWLIIILIPLLLFIPGFLGLIFENNNLIDGYLYALIFIPFFSKLILKQEIYKHQYISLIISILLFILINIPKFLLFELKDIIPHLLNFIGYGISSVSFILIKYAFDTYFISPYKLCFLMGIIYIPLNSFEFLIYSLIKYNDLSYFNDCLNFSEVENKIKIAIYIIICFLFFSTYRIIRLIVIFYFSPILYLVTDIVYYVVDWIILTIKNGASSMPFDALYPIGYFIIVLSVLIYNEIIILNFCGMNKNTKIFVEHRQSKESIELTKYQNNILFDDLNKNDGDNISVNSDYYLSENK